MMGSMHHTSDNLLLLFSFFNLTACTWSSWDISTWIHR